MSDESRRENYTEASTQFQQLRAGQELTEQQKDKLRNLAEKMNKQGSPSPESIEVDGYQILQAVGKAIGLEWYELLTTTSLPHPMPAHSFMA